MTELVSEPDALLRLAEKAARTGGDALMERFRALAAGAVSKKGQADYVSEADTAAEAAIAAVLGEDPNSFGFLGEETGFSAGARPEMWVVDPLDGTSNFVWGIPYFAVSIALCDAEGEILGVVYDPVRNDMHSAIRGKGAWLNGEPVSKLAPKSPSEAMISVSMPVPGQLRAISRGRFLEGLQACLDGTAGIRRLGSAALDLAYVGCGRLDGYFEDGLSYYDLAAGKLFALEAGAQVTDETGAPAREGAVFAGEAGMHAWLTRTFLQE
ncbi:inositol monophosphatase family protein [Martelella endophytica]|uniref:Inositol-1-monophosphatase n=1 Tax=Martelella endophytica TaxID=1486262 RepID=A0A0D5LMQ8_MAREN|nr:inositol monophosphatase family protein [Martelella endophytica]AJY45416.1 extragenic suppressor protein SuhB [Martelella endophytica]